MREIEFRGKDIATNKWVYGYLYRLKGVYTISKNIRYDDETPIFIDTVGQYTELKDKNGKKIFEGDIVRVLGGIYEQGFYEINETSVVKDIIKDRYELMMVISQLGENAIEVIGNIHDNPELLEV